MNDLTRMEQALLACALSVYASGTLPKVAAERVDAMATTAAKLGLVACRQGKWVYYYPVAMCAHAPK